jgi:hypothetical protein
MNEVRRTWRPSKWFCCTYPFIIRLSGSGWLKCGGSLVHKSALLQPKAQFSSTFWRPFNKKSLWTLPPKILWQICGPARQCPTVLTFKLLCGLPLVSTTDCTTLIHLFLLLVTVNTFDTISTKFCLICGEHWWDKKIHHMFADQTTNTNYPMVFDQQAVNPPHVVNSKGTPAAHGVPPNGHMTNSKCCHLLCAADSWPPSTFSYIHSSRSGVHANLDLLPSAVTGAMFQSLQMDGTL